jgi:NAD(P)-dependent dehydrogenase (short-subunit alcohol dehydrogenase family)
MSLFSLARRLPAIVLAFLIVLEKVTPAMSMAASKKVLVTGANKGIGLAICKSLLEQYPEVHVLLGSRDTGRGEQAVQKLLEEVPGCQDRLELLQVDTTSDDSVQAAAASLKDPLYGIVNNAGIGFGRTFEETITTNYFGPRRVSDAFSKHLVRPGGRIVNIASASGPNFLSRLAIPELKEKLTYPTTLFTGGIPEVDELAKSYFPQLDYGNDAYGLSKALLNAYTALYAKAEPDLVINSCSPGYIDTDLTAGMGATSPPSKGAVCPVWLLMSDEHLAYPTGRYYGSDCVRSPIHFYRGPGEAPYDGPDA